MTIAADIVRRLADDPDTGSDCRYNAVPARASPNNFGSLARAPAAARGNGILTVNAYGIWYDATQVT